MIKVISGLTMCMGLSIAGATSAESDAIVQPLSKEWASIAMITKLHLLPRSQDGLEVRVLEADGSASVAWDPVSLFVVARRRDTNPVSYVWRLPQGVAQVHKVSAAKCGVEIVAGIDKFDDNDRIVGQRRVVLTACFLGPGGAAQRELGVKMRESPTGASKRSSNTVPAATPTHLERKSPSEKGGP